MPTELRERDRLILRLLSVASAQSKHISLLGSRGNASVSGLQDHTALAKDSDATIPWSGGEKIHPIGLSTMGEDVWLSLGAKPRTQACSTPSIPEPWVQVKNSKSRRSPERLQLLSREALQLENKFQVLENLTSPSSPVHPDPVHPDPAGCPVASRDQPANRFDILDKNEFPPLTSPSLPGAERSSLASAHLP